MPLDTKFEERFTGFFHERQSHAPRFSTSCRFPRSNIESDLQPGPIATKLAEKKSFSASFGSSKRDDLWLRKECETRSKVAQLEGNGSVSITPLKRATTPTYSTGRQYEHQNQYQQQQQPQAYTRYDTPTRAVVGPVSFTHAKRFYDPLVVKQGEPRRKPGPATYDTLAQPGTFSLRERTAGLMDQSQRRVLMEKYAREGTHTPRRYETSLMGPMAGGAIPRAGRSGLGLFAEQLRESANSPGPGAYQPQYGLRSR